MPGSVADQTWESLQNRVKAGIKENFPLEGKKNSLVLHDITIDEKHAVSGDIRSQEQAKMLGRTWGAQVVGDIGLVDKATGQEIDRVKMRLITLPKPTQRYSYIVDGSEKQVDNVWRLRSGVYAHIKQNGEHQTEFNLKTPLARYSKIYIPFNPEKKTFNFQIETSNFPLYAVLKATGVSDDDMKKTWGPEVYKANFKTDKQVQQKITDLYDKLATRGVKADGDKLEDKAAAIWKTFEQAELIPEITKATLGKPFKHVSGEALLLGSKRILDVARGEIPQDDRDSLMFKQLFSLDDFLHEKLIKPATKTSIKQRVSHNIDRQTKVREIVSAELFHRPIHDFFSTSQTARNPEQVNPLEMLSNHRATTIIAPDEGGIKNEFSITPEMQLINSSHFGFLDPIHTPEARVGITLHLPLGVRKEGNEVTTIVHDLKTGKQVRVTPAELHSGNVILPDQVKWVGGVPKPIASSVKMKDPKTHEILEKPFGQGRYVILSANQLFDESTNLLPFLQNDNGNRTMVAAKQLSQAVSLHQREAPYVQVKSSTAHTWERIIGTPWAHEAPFDGHVTAIKKDPTNGYADSIVLQAGDGKKHEIQVYNHFPLNDATSFMHSTPNVKVGDRVTKGQVIADANYTKGGTLALGTNLRVAYLPYKGYNFEDGIVISNSASKKLTSEHMHRMTLELDPEKDFLDKKKFTAFASTTANKMTKEQLNKIGDDGVIHVGQRVSSGDVLLAAIGKQDLTGEAARSMARLDKRMFSFRDKSISWESQHPGEVVKVSRSPTGKEVTVFIKTLEPTEIGDKIVGRHGNKGIITKILPDAEMPRIGGPDGEHTQVLMNPSGVPTRINLGQMLETAAGKIAHKTGKPYVVQNFGGGDIDYTQKVKDELKQHELSDTDELFDPKTGRKLGDALSGHQYIMKLKHQVEKKLSVRGGGSPKYSYSLDRTPSGTGADFPGQAIGQLELYALLAHGARANLREMATYKSEKHSGDRNNDTEHIDFWHRVQTGQPLPAPQIPFAYKKFEAYLTGLGINVKKEGHELVLQPLTDKGVLAMSNGEIIDAGRIVRGKDAKELEKGLFDPKITGGLPDDVGKGLKWCFHYNTKVLTSDGPKLIGDIVTQKLPLSVLSQNQKTGVLEYKRIVSYWRNPASDPLVSLQYDSAGHLNGYARRSSPSTLWCTPGHEIYTPHGKTHAKDMGGKFALVASHKLSSSQRQIVLGSLLGDSWLQGGETEGANYLWGCGHGLKQLPYLQMKAGLLQEFVDNPIRAHHKRAHGKWKARTTYRFRTIRHPEFTEIHELTHLDGVKTVTTEWLQEIDERGLAIWYFDDGSLTREKNGNSLTITLATNGFSREGVELIQEWLFSRWDLRSSIQREEEKYTGRDLGWVLMLSSNATRLFLKIVAPYAHECLYYKVTKTAFTKECIFCGTAVNPRYDVCDDCVLNDILREKTQRSYDSLQDKKSSVSSTVLRYGSWSAAQAMARGETPRIASAAPQDTLFDIRSTVGTRIGELRELSTKTTRPLKVFGVATTGDRHYSQAKVVYNIEVEDNHNYFANGLLVGNSHISLPEPVPNPVFVGTSRHPGPAVVLTGMKFAEFEDLARGKTSIDGKTGGMAINSMLKNIDVKTEMAKMKTSMPTLRGTILDKANRKMKFLQALDKLGMKPQDAYMMNVLPVMPPVFRPLIPMPDGSLRPDDVNYYYKSLAHVIQQFKSAPKELGEEGVKDLREDIYEYTRGLAGLPGGRPLYEASRQKKGILETISGTSPKEGFFQKKLMKRRQDLSMRSTIIPEPAMDLDSVGVPRDAAMELYKPFVAREMQLNGYDLIQSLKEIKQGTPIAWKSLANAMDKRPLLLKRDPALHKFSIMAFRPKLVEGKAIQIHPLVTAGYNADFDGDTMSAFVPLSDDAVRETYKMFPSNNLFSSTNGSIMYAPDHESLLGLHLLSKWGKETGKNFSTAQDAKKAKDLGNLHVNDVVHIGGKKTTLGRTLISEHLPDAMRKSSKIATLLQDPNFVFVKHTKDEASKRYGVHDMLSQIAKEDPKSFPATVDSLKNLGNHYSYELGFSIGLKDLTVNKNLRDKILVGYDADALKVKNNSKLTQAQKNAQTVEIYTNATKDLVKQIEPGFEKDKNNIYTMVNSGARSNMSQFRQMTIAPMLMKDGAGNTIPNPVRKSYSEGLDVGDYWTALHGARMGTLQRVEGTSEPGRLTKEIVNVVIPNMIISKDCGTSQGIMMDTHDSDVTDRYLAAPIKLPGGHSLLAGSVVDGNLLAQLKKHSIDRIVVRSPLKCHHAQGICAKCYGLNENGRTHEVGTNIGVIAGHALGEPATQLAMDSFHTGGVAASRGGGSVDKFTRLNELLEIPKTLKGAAVLARASGPVQKVEKDVATNGWNIFINNERHFVPAQRLPQYNNQTLRAGMEVKKGDKISNGSVNPRELLQHTDIHQVQNYLADELYNAIYKDERVKRRNIETVVRSLTDLTKVKDPGHSDHLYGDLIARTSAEEFNRNLKPGHKPIVHEPIIRGARQMAVDPPHEDWMARLNFQELQNTLLEGAAKGWKTNLHSSNPVPAYARGSEFGIGTKEKPHYY